MLIPRAPDLPLPDSVKPLPTSHCLSALLPKVAESLAKKLGLEQQLRALEQELVEK